MKSLVVLDGFTLNPGDLSWDGLNQLGEVTVFDRTLETEIVQRSKEANILLTNKVPLNREILQQLPRLKYIGVLATGYNIIDLSACKERGIVVTNVPGYSTESVAQVVFALLLELTHRVGHHSRYVHSGKWSQSLDFCFWDSPLIELSGKTFGIVGFGRIGQAVARIATAFGMKVMVATRTHKKSEHPQIQFASIDEVFKNGDIVSLHCPLNSETQQMVNESRLKRMKRTAYLINTGRGPLIDEKALRQALDAGDLAGAGLDVLTVEPPPVDHPLLGARNCVITPHFAWGTQASRSRLMNQVVENVRAFLKGSPVNVVSS